MGFFSLFLNLIFRRIFGKSKGKQDKIILKSVIYLICSFLETSILILPLILPLITIPLMLNVVVTSTYVVENIDEIVASIESKPIGSYSGILSFGSIPQQSIIEMDMLADDVIQTLKTENFGDNNKWSEFITKELLLGVPCVETSGDLSDFSEKRSLFDNLASTKHDNSSNARGLYQMIVSIESDRHKGYWLSGSFNSKHAKSIDTSWARPNVYYVPDAMYSLGKTLIISELKQVDSLYGTYIAEALSKFNFNLSKNQLIEVYQALGCAKYHGIPKIDGLDTARERKALVNFLVCSVYELGSFAKLNIYATDSFHDSVRNIILGEKDDYAPITKEIPALNMKTGVLKETPLIKYISDKYDSEITMVYDIQKRTGKAVFLNFAYGIGAIACGNYRVLTVENIQRSLNIDIKNDATYREVQSYCLNNGIELTKNYVELTQLKDYTIGSKINITRYSYQFKGNKFTYPLFTFDPEVLPRSDGRIAENVIYIASSHLYNRAFLVDLPSVFTSQGVTGKICDMRIIPALDSMKKAWDSYKRENSIESQTTVKVISCFRTIEESKYLLVKYANMLVLGGRSNWVLSEWETIVKDAYESTGVLYETAQATNLRKLAARPGYSTHHTGRVLDLMYLGETGGFDEKYYDWLIKNANYFGFFNYPQEAWHWEYNPRK